MTLRLVPAFLVAVLLLPSALARADNPQLVGSVGANDAFVISLKDPPGNVVSHLDPGTYDIAVSDLSELHNFHLKGPGVDMATAVDAKQDANWTVTFSDGVYTYVCDEHSSVMHGRFTVGAVPAAPAKLSGSVGPRQTISLRPKTVAAGAVVLTVKDSTRTDNFHLTGPGVNKKTGVAFRGRVTWNLTLAAGRYTYRSDKHTKLRGTLTVTAA